MMLFHYYANFLDEMNDLAETQEEGIVAASDYGAAANRVVSYYGKDNLISVKLIALDDPLSKAEVMEEFKQ